MRVVFGVSGSSVYIFRNWGILTRLVCSRVSMLNRRDIGWLIYLGVGIWVWRLLYSGVGIC